MDNIAFYERKRPTTYLGHTPNMGGTLCQTRNMENAEKVSAESLGVWISYPNKPTGEILFDLGNQPKV